MVTYYKLSNRGTSAVFLEVCPVPGDWSKKCSPCKIDFRLTVRHALMVRSWWSDRGLETNVETHSAKFIVEP